jgi:hypothetical protein
MAGTSPAMTVRENGSRFDRTTASPDKPINLPDGQITDLLSSPSAKNIPLLRRPKSTLQLPPSRPERGAYHDRHGRWARDAVDAAASGALVKQRADE